MRVLSALYALIAFALALVALLGIMGLIIVGLVLWLVDVGYRAW